MTFPYRSEKSLEDVLNCILLHLTWDVNKHYKTLLLSIQLFHSIIEKTHYEKYFLLCQLKSSFLKLPAENRSFIRVRSSVRVHSLSLLSRKSWILLRFSSCWPSASSKIPMGDFLSPALSILFSSLFFMFRRRSDACAKITETQKDKAL